MPACPADCRLHHFINRGVATKFSMRPVLNNEPAGVSLDFLPVKHAAGILPEIRLANGTTPAVFGEGATMAGRKGKGRNIFQFAVADIPL